MRRWAVIACDQFTSEPAYWEEADRIAGDAPSALRLILPEAELGSENVGEKIAAIRESMRSYLASGLFRVLPDSFLYTERLQSDGRIRRGLVGKIDLEAYDYNAGSTSPVRATEGTVLSRIPPRAAVRKDAPLELPHVLLLIDDPDKTVIEPLSALSGAGEPVYDFDLMLGGGHLRAYEVPEEEKKRIGEALSALADPSVQAAKYGLPGKAPLLFAVGDGNHSLATAKRCYELDKENTPPKAYLSLPSRWALVEVENLHDPALTFEPIHRIVFDTDPEELLDALKAYYPDAADGEGEGHVLRYVYTAPDGTSSVTGAVTVPHPEKQLCVGTLQDFLDSYAKDHPCRIDYIHDEDSLLKLASAPRSIGFLLPAMGKDELFRTVMADGVLPRKTFSMGHARDKRYYVEARKIK